MCKNPEVYPLIFSLFFKFKKYEFFNINVNMSHCVTKVQINAKKKILFLLKKNVLKSQLS